MIDSREISELNDILLGQRNSEEGHYNTIEPNVNPLECDTSDVNQLKQELLETKNRLREVEGKFNKIKVLFYTQHYICSLLLLEHQ